MQETTRAGPDEVRRIARRLRPGVLDERGPASALKSLTTDVGGPRLSIRHRLDTDLPPLGRDAEPDLYRVAQEGLTDVARHTRARHTEIVLRRTGPGVGLCVRDDGQRGGDAAEGAGIRGMREHALLIGAGLTLGSGPGGGTEVRLTVPVPTPAHDPDRNGRS